MLRVTASYRESKTVYYCNSVTSRCPQGLKHPSAVIKGFEITVLCISSCSVPQVLLSAEGILERLAGVWQGARRDDAAETVTIE